jgi:hypothetical protein
MRLRGRTSVEPLQKMIPEFSIELPSPSFSDVPRTFSAPSALNLLTYRSSTSADTIAPPENC